MVEKLTEKLKLMSIVRDYYSSNGNVGKINDSADQPTCASVFVAATQSFVS